MVVHKKIKADLDAQLASIICFKFQRLILSEVASKLNNQRLLRLIKRLKHQRLQNHNLKIEDLKLPQHLVGHL